MADEARLNMNSVEIDLDDQSIVDLYINGFAVTLGTGDVLVTLHRNNRPIQRLQMSYTLAKTLASSLGQTMAALEELTGNEIMTTHYVAEKMQGYIEESRNE